MDIEMEDVKLGSWESSIPSEICTNKEIFSEIFSLNTWNNVLGKEQREKLMKFLPKEISSNPIESQKLIAELFNGSLTLFSRNPIANFFKRLESGQYDPYVIEMKGNIKKELVKESSRQWQDYHTQLLEDIVVSRARLLTKVKAKVANESHPRTAKPSIKKNPKKQGPLQNASSELNSKLLEMNNTNLEKESIKLQSVKFGGNVEENGQPILTASNPGRKRKGKDEDVDDTLDKPMPKKLANSKQKLIVTEDKSTPKIASSLNINTVLQNVKLEPKSPPSSQAKLENVEYIECSVPTSGTNISTVRHLNYSSFSTSSSTTSENLVNVTLSTEKRSATGPMLTSSFPTSIISPSESSPILASQLQQGCLSSSTSRQFSVKVEDSLGLFSSSSDPDPDSESCRITLNYTKIEDKNEEEESASDEFEAIHPTIGFGNTLPTSTLTGILSPVSSSTLTKVILSPNNLPIMSSSAVSSVVVSSASPNRIIQMQQQPQITVSTIGHSLITSTPSNILAQAPAPVYIVNAKSFSEAHQRILQIPKDHRLPISLSSISSPQQFTFVNSTPTRFVMKSELQHQQPQFKSILATTQASEIIRITSADLVGAKTSSTTSGVHYLSTGNGQNLILHPVVNVAAPMTMTTTSSSPANFSNVNIVTSCANNTSGNFHFVSNQNQNIQIQPQAPPPQQKNSTENVSSLNSSSSTTNMLTDAEDLNLSLGSLGSLGPMNVSGMSNISVGSELEKMMDMEHENEAEQLIKLEVDGMDKIDDLSVLDGNPFDSIPNLSDELDGLDLDLVDGLCDFESLLSEEKKYASFFSLIRDVLCSTRDHRMNLICLEKTIKKWSLGPSAAQNAWFLKVSDWNKALVTGLNFLAGSYQDVHPEDFVPYIEYKYKTKFYQWIGAGRDSDNNLTPLCAIWMDHLDQLPTAKKLDGETEDQEEEDEDGDDDFGDDPKRKHKRPVTPPPPRCVTDWTVRPSTKEEKEMFRLQEQSRFENPHKAFTYNTHDYESVVGPVKGVYSSQVGLTNKARGHSLLVDDRPPYVTILALVRDAVARLPNGEGTRSEICEMLRDSAFLAHNASSVTLNSVVSGALDRLHYERDPCVRYDSHKKSWIYLHRDRGQEQFERLHHNRSYTKSTKSRNSASRKARRPASKVITPTASSSFTNPATPTSSSSVTTVSSPTEDSNILSPVSTPTTATTAVSQTSVATVTKPNNTLSGTTISETCVAIHPDISKVKVEKESSIAVPSPSESIPEQPMKINVVISSATTQAPQQQQQFIVQTQASIGSTLITSSSPQNTIQLAQSSTISPTGVAIKSSAPSGNANNQGQVMLTPQALLQLTNALRLGQVRLPGNVNATNATAPGSVRLPQHRILLTRGAVPGQPQTQGILLGQTATGQTVILSTGPPGSIGSFQNLSTTAGQFGALLQQQQLQQQLQQQQQPQQHQPIQILQSSSSNSNKSPSLKPIMSQTIARKSSPVIDAAAKMIQLNISGIQNKSNCSNLTTTSSHQQSTVTINSQGRPEYTAASSTTTQQQRHPTNYTIAPKSLAVRQTQPSPKGACSNNQSPATTTIQFHSMGTSQGVITTSSSTDGIEPSSLGVSTSQSGGGTMSSPIIIRSVAGDLIALGKGLQGIKLVPFPMGNTTVMAKIVPSTSSPTPISVSTPTTRIAVSSTGIKTSSVAPIQSPTTSIVVSSSPSPPVVVASKSQP